MAELLRGVAGFNWDKRITGKNESKHGVTDRESEEILRGANSYEQHFLANFTHSITRRASFLIDLWSSLGVQEANRRFGLRR